MYIHAVPYLSAVYTCGSVTQLCIYMRYLITVMYIHAVPYLSFICTCGCLSQLCIYIRFRISVMYIHVHAVLLVSQL